MTMTREKELWALAVWVERHHGDNGDEFIENRIAALEAEGETDGADLWRIVADRYHKLRVGLIPIHGQPETLPN
ncbi:hypothetical protein [Erythrobacter sp. THAF29]|uniref:DUF6961 family protein n=1 Tax=Erythrobacter sp. THAF29 TaxID=2587851 RepID=UPI001267ABBB|nr:hypothetical protein [Erythrobacter sp. THAF29]QFT76005.1 hypothetical protein FIU90_00480 [Erythrobacter sp. THAF29]